MTGSLDGQTPSRTPPSRHLPAGTRLGHNYEIISLIGEGGMGIVYRAWDVEMQRQVAIKTLHSNLMGDAGIQRRFLREGGLMTRWNHKNIATVYDIVRTDDVIAIVMELIEGTSLDRNLVAWGGRIPYAELEGIFGGVLDAIGHAHQRGIVHRDVKPGNILLRADPEGWTPKVIDFGIAKVLEGTTYTMTGALMGTCRYMSPEQARQPEILDHRADIYSLGVTLFEAVCGQCPFEMENQFSLMMAHVMEPPPAPSSLRDDVPPALETLILDCLAKSPDDRPQSCTVVHRRLSAALAAHTPTKRAEAASPARIAHAHGGVLLRVPRGAFQMGPRRRSVWLDAFHIDQRPVTNRQFKRFMEATGYRPAGQAARRFLAHWRGGEIPAGLDDHPVVYVSWLDAAAYSSWAGLRLPTEAEWEKAARGTDGRRYPWGRTNPGTRHAHFNRSPQVGTAPVGRYPDGASPYGVEDMAGNIYEWCADADDARFYEQGPARNPQNPCDAQGCNAVVRGGAWMFDAPALRTWARSSFPSSYQLNMVGFRCAL